jgi:hypothetical protein
MARQAETVTISAMPSDRERWERHQQARDVGRSELWRHTLDLLDREELVTELRALQDHGDAAAALHLPDHAAIEDAMRRSLARPTDELDEQISALVDLIAQPTVPSSRRRRPLPAALLADQAEQVPKG